MMYSPYIWPLILAAFLMAGIAIYTRGFKGITRPRLARVLLAPAIITVLAYTSPYHTLFRYNFRLDTTHGLAGLVYDRGPFFILYMACISLPNITATVLLVRATFSDREHFWNTIL